MAFGLGRLGWSPAEFWAATPREVAAALRAHGSPGRDPIGREALSLLIATYPDG